MPARLILVADISNYTGAITPEQVAGLRAAGIGHVIVRISPESPELAAITRQQLAALRAADMPVSGYLFPEYGADPGQFLARALDIAGPLATLWIDIEPPDLPSAAAVWDWVLRAVPACPVLVGIYTAAWVIARLVGWEPVPLPLWAARYGERPTSLEVDFGGWTRAAGIQYAADQTVVGVLCDLSAFDPAVLT